MVFNYFFISLIVISFAAYFYFKTKQFRSTLPIRKKWYKAKAGVALGIFIISFGINTLIVQHSAVGYIVGIIFIVIGGMQSYTNFKRAMHEGKFVEEEYELNKK